MGIGRGFFVFKLGGGMFMLCCGRYIKPYQILELDDYGKYTNQVLEIGYCPEHAKKKGFGTICKLTYFDKELNDFRTYRPKGQKDIEELILRAKKNQTVESLFRRYKASLKQGTKGGMAFVHGRNVQLKDRVRQYAVDFNGTATLVKELIV